MKNKLYKKCLSLIVIMAMVMTTFAGSGITAMAGTGTPDPVTSVELTIDTELLKAGTLYSDATHGVSAWSVDSPSSCVVEKVEWFNCDHLPLDEGARIDYYNDTYVNVWLTLEEGEFATYHDVETTVNGMSATPIGGGEGKSLILEWSFKSDDANIIEDVYLIDVPEAIAGEEIKPYSYTYEESGEDLYTAVGVWQVYNYETESYETTSETTFADGNPYRLRIDMETMPGTVFTEYPNFYVNGEETNGRFDRWYDSYMTLYLQTNVGLDELDWIEIDEDAFPDVAVGKKFTDTTIPVPVDDERYTVEGHWVDEDGNVEGTFTKGKDYRFEYTVTANKGYGFADDITIVVGDNAVGTSGGEPQVYGTVVKSLKTPIDEVILTNVPTAKVGDTLKAGEIELTAPDGAKYEAYAYWADYYEGSIEKDTVVKEGKLYELWIQLTAAEGYIFAEEYTLILDGQKAVLQTGGADWDFYYREYSFLPQIDSIEINGFKEPVIGEAASTDTLKVPASANYEIMYAQWYDSRTYEEATTFEKGHAYFLGVDIVAKEGYEFAPYAQWTMGDNSGRLDSYATEGAYISTDDYSFEKYIDRVDISNIPTIKIGETATADVKVPDDVNYDVQAQWYVWNYELGRYEEFNDTFAEGETYELGIYIIAKEGYRFDEDSVICYLDGKESVPEHVYMHYIEFDRYYPNAADKLIDKVELTIEEPVTGDHSSVKPVMNVLGEGYEVVFNGSSGDPYWNELYMGERTSFNGYFEDGKDYGVKFYLVAKEGYAFAEDVVVMVNGVIVSTDNTYNEIKKLYVDYWFADECEHVYGQDGACVACGFIEKPTGDTGAADETAKVPVPNTGDNLALEMALIIMVLSVIAIIALTVSRKKNN